MELFDFKEAKYLERDTNTPTFTGKVESEIGKGGQIEITLGDKRYYVDINPTDGSWSWTPPEALADGAYNIAFQSIDKAGNTSRSSLHTLVVDTTPPVAPTLLNLYDDQGAITGSFDAGKMTDDRRPTLTGIAEKGTVVYLKEGNTVIGSAKADEKTGLWTLEPTVDLADGRHNLTLVAAETFADKLREGKPSDEFSIIIGKDGDVPSDPGGVAKIIEAIDNAGSLTGSLKSGGITDDTTPELRGSAPEGSVVRIQYRNDKGEWIDGGNAVMNGTSWSWTPDPALGAGNWEFRANAGSGWTDEFKLDIDLAPAAKTEITHAYDDFGPFTGMLGNGAITDDRTPNLHGRAESNSLVYIHYRNVLGAWELLDSVTAGADGRWEYETDRLSPGTYEFQAGTSGTRDTNGKPFGLQIVAAGTFIPVIESAWDVQGFTGDIKNGASTDDTTPTLNGVAEANSTIILEYSLKNSSTNFSVTVQADNTGHWSFTPPELKKGEWSFTPKSINGETSPHSFIINIANEVIRENFYDFKTIPSNSGLKLDQIFDKNKKYNLHSDFDVVSKVGDVSYFDVVNFPSLRQGLRIGSGKSTAETDFLFKGSSKISFSIGAGNKGSFIVDIYDTEGKLIRTESFILSDSANGYAIDKFEFISNDRLIGKMTLHITDSNGVVLDDLHWDSVSYSNSIDTSIQSGHNVTAYDLTVSKESDLMLNIETLLENGQKDLFIDDGKTQLMVNGNQGDTVRLEDILPEGSEQNGWAEQAGTVTIAGTQYHVWSNGDAELLVQDGVKTELV